MITQEQIQILANKYQTTELNIRREYLQHLFLSYFYQQPETTKIYFKGGTALKILYGSPRFSEDLDFNSGATEFKNIERALLSTLLEIEREGIKINLNEAKKTSGGYLAVIEGYLPEKLTIQLQISWRRKKSKPQLVTAVNDFVPTYTLIGLSTEQLIGEKIQALFARRLPRDFYDLYFALRANLLSPDQKKSLPRLLILIRKTKINFAKELRSFLPKSHWLIVKDFKETLKQETQRFV